MDNFNHCEKEWTYVFKGPHGYVWCNTDTFPTNYWIDGRKYYIFHHGKLFATNNHLPVPAQNGLCKIEP